MGTRLFGPDGPVRFSDQVDRDVTPVLEKDLVVQTLPLSRWRVSDGRYAEHGPDSLLGFIEQKGDSFELTQLEHGFQWFYYSSLALAVNHFTQTAPHDYLPEKEWS